MVGGVRDRSSTKLAPADAPADPRPSRSGGALLVADRVCAGYGARDVLHDVSLAVGPGEMVAVIGHNGAGKSTLLQALIGLIPTRSGRVALDGAEITHLPTPARVRRGIAYSPQENPTFAPLSVDRNLRLGLRTVDDQQARDERMEEVLDLFPFLRTCLRRAASTLSGGERRYLGLAIAMLSNPRLLLLDEPSLGVAPNLFDRIVESLKTWSRRHSMAVVMVEQRLDIVLAECDWVYVLRNGELISSQPSTAAAEDSDLWELF